jgi:hypothetical protein
VLSWVVTLRPIPRRSRKSHSRRVLPPSNHATNLCLELGRSGVAMCGSCFSSFLPNFQLSTPSRLRKSFPHKSFAGPHALTLLELHRFKNREGVFTRSDASTGAPFGQGLSPLDATLPHHPASVDSRPFTGNVQRRKAFSCNIYKKTRGGGTYLFTSLLRCFVFILSVPLRRTYFGATIRKGTGILYDAGKQLRSSRCLRLRERTMGQALSPLCKSCLGPAF